MQRSLLPWVWIFGVLVQCGQAGEPATLSSENGDNAGVGDQAESTAGTGQATGDGGGRPDSTSRGGAGDAGHCLCAGVSEITWSDVNCFCAQFSCPELSVLLEARDSCQAAPSSLEQGPYLRRGCGRVEYEWGSFSGGARYQLDETTGEYLGATGTSDIGFGPCNRSQYTGGTFLDLAACADFSECLNCRTLLPEPDATPSCPQD
jgi:hypothetical protein